jgi:hypothetical protein
VLCGTDLIDEADREFAFGGKHCCGRVFALRPKRALRLHYMRRLLCLLTLPLLGANLAAALVAFPLLRELLPTMPEEFTKADLAVKLTEKGFVLNSRELSNAITFQVTQGNIVRGAARGQPYRVVPEMRRELSLPQAPRFYSWEHWRRFMVLAVGTASRVTALLELKWEQIDLRIGRIRLNPEGRRQTKKRRVTVPSLQRLPQNSRAGSATLHMCSATTASPCAVADSMICWSRKPASPKARMSSVTRCARGLRTWGYPIQKPTFSWAIRAKAAPVASARSIVGRSTSRALPKASSCYTRRWRNLSSGPSRGAKWSINRARKTRFATRCVATAWQVIPLAYVT